MKRTERWVPALILALLFAVAAGVVQDADASAEEEDRSEAVFSEPYHITSRTFSP